MPRPNYYLLLDIEPTVDDPTAIEQIIVRKQSEWAKLLGHPSAKRQSTAKAFYFLNYD